MNAYKIFYVESYAAWFLIFARTYKAARKEGVKNYGRGMVKGVRLATRKEIKYFRSIKSEIGTAEE